MFLLLSVDTSQCIQAAKTHLLLLRRRGSAPRRWRRRRRGNCGHAGIGARALATGRGCHGGAAAFTLRRPLWIPPRCGGGQGRGAATSRCGPTRHRQPRHNVFNDERRYSACTRARHGAVRDLAPYRGCVRIDVVPRSCASMLLWSKVRSKISAGGILVHRFSSCR